MSRTRIPKRISVDWLCRNSACIDAVCTFEHMFGKSAELTPANLSRFEKEHDEPVAWWLTKKLLGSEIHLEIEDKADAAYRRTYRRLFWREVEKQRGEQS